MAKPHLKAQARQLRSEGHSLNEIVAQLDIAKSTASVWTSDIALTSYQQERLRLKELANWQLAGMRRSAKAKVLRGRWQEDGRRLATMHMDESLFVAGTMLYWAEGYKHRNSLQFCNADLAMHQMFRRFLVEYLACDPSKHLVWRLKYYTDNDLSDQQISRYWIDGIGLGPDKARKHQIDVYPKSSVHRSYRKLPYGICYVSWHSTQAIQTIFGAIQELSGIDNPDWTT